MAEFIEKNRLYIGITLVLVILAGSGVLLWRNQAGGLFNSGQGKEAADLRAENQSLRNKIIELEKNGDSSQPAESGTVKSSQTVSERININTADAKTLDGLPGIGPTRAQQIIEYRNAHGGFQKIEDIIKVSGIGAVTFEKIRDRITTQ